MAHFPKASLFGKLKALYAAAEKSIVWSALASRVFGKAGTGGPGDGQ
jgi:hypothetical protein